MTNRYPPESPTPNWPKELKPDRFDRYCGPVLQAIQTGIDRILNQVGENDPTKIFNRPTTSRLKSKMDNRAGEPE